MALTVTTKDTTALSDAELEEMANLCVDREPNFDIGFLSKQREEWVLVTQAREGERLRGYSFETLERIGGTPSLLIGLMLVERNAKSDATLRAILHDQFRRALLAFPDEDVLMGTRLSSPDGLRAFTGLQDVVPRTGYRPTGEDRAWARRLAKRFGAEKWVDDHRFVLSPPITPVGCLDYANAKGALPDDAVALFDGLRPEEGERLVVFGWAMAEALASGKLPRSS